MKRLFLALLLAGGLFAQNQAIDDRAHTFSKPIVFGNTVNFTGNTTHAGTDTFNGPVNFNGLVTINGTAASAALVNTANTFQQAQTFKAGPWFDVRAYGAVGDGVTDDRAAAVAALTAAKVAGGGTVFFPAPYTFGLSNVLDLSNASHIRIEVQKGANLKAIGSATGNALVGGSGAVNDIEISGGTWLGNSRSSQCVFFASTSPAAAVTNISIHDIDCSGTVGAGIQATDNSAQSSKYNTNNIRIYNNTVHDTGQFGIAETYSVNTIIRNNRIYNSGTGYAPLFFAGVGTVVEGNIITLTHGSSFNDRAIGSFSADQFTVANNVIQGTPGLNLNGGILMHIDTGRNGTIIGNTLNGYKSHSGIDCEVCRNVTISGNTVQDTYGFGIKVDHRGDDRQVNALDSTTGLTFGSNITASVDNVDFQEGTGSVQAVIGVGGTSGLLIDQDYGTTQDFTQLGAADPNARDMIDLWVKSDTAIPSNVLHLQLSPNTGLTSPSWDIPLQSIPANTWVRLQVDGAKAYPVFVTVKSWGIYAASTIGPLTLHFDDARIDTTGDHMVVIGNTVRRAGNSYGIEAYTNNTLVSGNIVEDPGASCGTGCNTSAVGIRVGDSGQGVYNGQGMTVSNNLVRYNNPTQTFNYGIMVTIATGTILDDVKVLNNDVQNAGIPVGTAGTSVGTLTNYVNCRNYTAPSTISNSDFCPGNINAVATNSATAGSNPTGGSVNIQFPAWNGSSSVVHNIGMNAQALPGSGTATSVQINWTANDNVTFLPVNLLYSNVAAATAGSGNLSSWKHILRSAYWNGTSSQLDNWTYQAVLGTGTTPTSTLQFLHTGSLGAAVVQVPALQFASDTGATMSNAPRMMWTCNVNTITAASSHCRMILDKGITVTRLFSYANAAALASCSTQPVIRVSNGTTNIDLTLANGSVGGDSGAIATSFAAGNTITFSVPTAGVGCTNAVGQNVTIQYVMQ